MSIDVFFNGGKKVNAIADKFVILTDQDIESGGEASAPEPFTLFLASLATCTGIYVQSFCKQRNIPTDDITLNMDWDYDTNLRMISKFRIDINVPTDFPEKYDNALIASASKCAVKRHLKDSIEMDMRLMRI